MKTELVDYHVYSTFSCDGKSSINDYCERAIELGIREIGFSEHVDFDPSDEGFRFFIYESYTSAIKAAQLLFKNKLVIRKGVEVDYQNRFEDQIRNWLCGKNFDFVIGSMHYVKGEIINQRLLTERDLREVYGEYFDEVEKSIKSHLFQVIGHLDIIRKFAVNQPIQQRDPDYRERIETILEQIKDQKMFLEINTKPSVPKHRSIEMLPSKEMVRKYLNCEGKRVSLGSDAHSIEELGSGIKETFKFLIENGLTDIIFLFE